MLLRAFIALCLAAFAVAGSAATILGQLTAPGGAGVGGYQVQVYGLAAKGWTPVATTTTIANGDYSVTVPAGEYLVRAVPSNTTTQCLMARRWYDVFAPNASGLIESAADVILLSTSGSAVTGINMTIPTVGAFDGRITQAGNGVNGMQVRVEQVSEPRNYADLITFTNAGVAGSYSACGLDPGSYRIRVHAPNSEYEDLVSNGPFIVVAAARPTIANLALSPIGSDPSEPNQSAIGGTPVPAILDAWTSTNAIITPRASDPDFYCFPALAGDRYLITTDTTSLVGGQPSPSPWMDPQIGWYARSPVQQLAVNDDDPLAPGSLNSRIATGPVPADGSYCVGVTTFGDTDFNGTGQISAGRYVLRIARVVDALFADGFE